jgi:hypothetical protein
MRMLKCCDKEFFPDLLDLDLCVVRSLVVRIILLFIRCTLVLIFILCALDRNRVVVILALGHAQSFQGVRRGQAGCVKIVRLLILLHCLLGGVIINACGFALIIAGF